MMMVVVVVLGHQQKMPHNLVGCEIKARHVSQPTLYGRISIKQWVNRPSVFIVQIIKLEWILSLTFFITLKGLLLELGQ